MLSLPGGETARPERLLGGGVWASPSEMEWRGQVGQPALTACLSRFEGTGQPARVGYLSISFHSGRPAPLTVGSGRGEWMPRRAHRVGDRRHPRRSKLGVAC